MGNVWERQRMSRYFLALGQSYGLSTWQAQELWERLLEHPQFFRSRQPELWLDGAFRREAEAMGQAKPEPEESNSFLGGGRMEVGKRTLVEEVYSGYGGRRLPPVSDVGKRTLVEEYYAAAPKWSFDDCEAVALRDVLLRIGTHRELELATLAAADPNAAERVIDVKYGAPFASNRRLPGHPGDPSELHPTPQGQALWGAARARAVTLYRRATAVGMGAPQTREVSAALDEIGEGASLPDAVRRRMEAMVGETLENVRLHTGPVAVAACEAVNAEAFTVGQDIYYPGFDPGSLESLKTLAHECVHVQQWQQGRVAPAIAGPSAGPTVSQTHDPLEQEAEAIVARAFSEPVLGDEGQATGEAGQDPNSRGAGTREGSDVVARFGDFYPRRLQSEGVNPSAGVGQDAVLMRKARYHAPRSGAARSSPPSHSGAEPAEHELVEVEGKRWKVFEETGKPYKIEPRNGLPGAHVVRDWVRHTPGLIRKAITNKRNRTTKVLWKSPTCAREILQALGWVDPARLDYAAQNVYFHFTKDVDYLPFHASTFHQTGLPPGVDGIAQRGPNHSLEVTVRLDDPTLPPRTLHDMTADEETRILKALTDLTGLELDPEGLAQFQSRSEPIRFLTGNGTIADRLFPEVCHLLFGKVAYEQWLTGKRPTPKELETPKLKLENYYQRKIPGTLTHFGDIVEAGENIRLEVQVDWPHGAPDPAIYSTPPMVTPGKFGNVALLRCAWRFERIPSGTKPGTGTGASAGSAPNTSPATAASASAASDRAAPPPASPEDIGTNVDNVSPSSSSAGASAVAAPTSVAPTTPGAPSNLTAVPRGPDQVTETAEVFHRFALEPGEMSAVFHVTCEARFDEYFAPATFTRDIVVHTGAAAMASLRTAAFAGLGTSDDARRGEAWTGDAAPELSRAPRPGEPSVDERAALSRATQREQLRAVRAYLAGKPASADAVAAIDRELQRQDNTEKLLAQDRERGWQSFQIRGTYLSRTEGLPSGPLDLHGTVHVVRHYDSYPGDGPSTTQRIRNDQYVVQIRDLSRRFDQKDFAFERSGSSFDAALKAAFDDLAIAYPNGVLAIEAEQFASGSGATSGEAVLGGRTGKVVGFERNTESTWEKVKDKVWSPVASIATNLGAIALMALVPGSAAIVAPAILAYNTIPTLDRVASESAQGTLTLGSFSMAAGEIALNLLPLVGRAKPFTAGWFAVETANWGGQTALMTATAIDIAEQLQAKQVVALAAEYEAFLKLRQNSLPSDPHLAQAEAEIRARAAEVAGAITEQFLLQIRDNGIVMATGSVVHHTSVRARMAVVERLARSKPEGTAQPVALAGSDAPPAGDPVAAPTVEEAAAAPPSAAEGTQADAPAQRPARTGDPADVVPAGRTPIILSGDDLMMRELARNIPPIPGYVDVVVHGSTDSFAVLRADQDITIDQRAFATYLRKHGLEGQKIRLISCETGRHPKGIAQQLANKLNVEVLAPSDVAWVHPDGNITIGHRTRNTGTWVPHQPKPSELRSTPASPLKDEQRPYRPEDEVDYEPPEHAAPLPHDQRARATQADAPELARLLGASVIFDETLTNGVEVQVHRVDKLFGFDLEVQSVRVGKNALLADVLTHASTIKNVERYNGIVGRLRQLAERFAAWTTGRPAAKYPHGSRAWKTHEELTKLSSLLTQRRAEFGNGTVDPHTLREEIEFLSGRHAYHEEVLRSLEDYGKGFDGDFTIAAPDVGRVTNEAIAAGYKLPSTEMGVKADWYYYRHKRSSPDEFELALKPSAPYDAPSVQARTISGKFVGFEKPSRVESAELPYDMSQEDAVIALRQTAGFKAYAEMLEGTGIASKTVIDGIIRHKRSERMTTGKPVYTDYLRHAVKDYFRPRVMERLLDPKLSETASWQQLREMIDKLPASDRGNLAEDWHRGRHAPNADPRVNVGVPRDTGPNAGKIESRVIDAVDGNTAVEVKDITGRIDEDQLGAYLDMMAGKLRTGVTGKQPPEITKVKYVFTKTEGAIANLKLFAEHLTIQDNVGRLTVEVFDWQGNRHTVTTPTQALQLHGQLTAPRSQSL